MICNQTRVPSSGNSLRRQQGGKRWANVKGGDTKATTKPKTYSAAKEVRFDLEKLRDWLAR